MVVQILRSSNPIWYYIGRPNDIEPDLKFSHITYYLSRSNVCLIPPILPEASACNCRESDIHMVTVVDLNVPLAKSKEKMEELCQLLQFTNDLAPSRHIGVIELPETAAKKFQKRFGRWRIRSTTNLMGTSSDMRYQVDPSFWRSPFGWCPNVPKEGTYHFHLISLWSTFILRTVPNET